MNRPILSFCGTNEGLAESLLRNGPVNKTCFIDQLQKGFSGAGGGRELGWGGSPGGGAAGAGEGSARGGCAQLQGQRGRRAPRTKSVSVPAIRLFVLWLAILQAPGPEASAFTRSGWKGGLGRFKYFILFFLNLPTNKNLSQPHGALALEQSLQGNVAFSSKLPLTSMPAASRSPESPELHRRRQGARVSHVAGPTRSVPAA